MHYGIDEDDGNSLPRPRGHLAHLVAMPEKSGPEGEMQREERFEAGIELAADEMFDAAKNDDRESFRRALVNAMKIAKAE